MINASSVKPIRDFSSGVLKTLLTSWAAAFSCAMSVLDAASGRDNTVTHRRAHPDAADGHRARERAVRQQLGGSLALPDQSRLDEHVGRDLVFRRQLVDVTQVHDLRLHPEWIGEAALGQTARERHLAALEMRLVAARSVMAGARLDAFVPLARRFARARPRTAASPLPVPMRSRGRHQIVQPDVLGCRCLALFLGHCAYSFTGVTVTR